MHPFATVIIRFNLHKEMGWAPKTWRPYLEENVPFPQCVLSWRYGRVWKHPFGLWMSLMSSWWVSHISGLCVHLFFIFNLSFKKKFQPSSWFQSWQIYFDIENCHKISTVHESPMALCQLCRSRCIVSQNCLLSACVYLYCWFLCFLGAKVWA